jgi:5-methylcytosine-specific restriction endonuclease McrBC regulatory subunit McrC
MRLFHFIKDGYLVDNQHYLFSDRKVQNSRLDDGGITFDARPGRRTKPEHYEDKIWNFINSVSRDIEEVLHDKDKRSDALVLFNNEEYEHNTDDGFISVSGTNATNFTLDTGNLIGFVKRGDYALKISSRFGDRFLQYIIADADGFLELKDVGGESDVDDYDWLLAYLWNIKFKRAYRLGLPKAYITRNERISKVRGYIDPVDFFQNKTSGKYLCSYREHSYNSPAVSLFVKAYEMVKHNSFCYESRNIYNSFVAANQGFKRSRQEILNTRPFSNPFYSDYNVLIDLSKRVIRRGGLTFGAEKDTSAFLFDVSMLFEYFIRKLLTRGGIQLLSKSERIPEIPTGSFGEYTRKLKPDIVFESNGDFYVFDVKYKIYDHRYGVKREDLFQLHTYIGQYANDGPIKGCGFIYPMPDDRLGESSGLISDVLYQQGNKIPFYVVFFPIPNDKNDNRHQFNNDMKKQCDIFVKKFQKLQIR